MWEDFYIDENGYYRYKDSGELVHRYIASQFVEHRSFRSDEVVHHINGNKLDNRPENLRVMKWDEHDVFHQELWNEKRNKSYQETNLDYGSIWNRLRSKSRTILKFILIIAISSLALIALFFFLFLQILAIIYAP